MIALNKDASKAWGWVDLNDADMISVLWAMFAVAAGLSLTVAAIAFARRTEHIDTLEFHGGYNALAPMVER